MASAVAGVDVVVNCAAFTDVDGAETHEPAAFTVNAVGPATLARACAESGAWLLHISTDYVFAGDATEPYPEDAPIAPRSAYGRTKAAGEWAVRAHLPDRFWILRTAWLYGWHGKNFVDTILRLAAERDTLDVVADQHGQPTWTVDLAHRIIDTVARDVPAGVYHATSTGHTTWHGLAQAASRAYRRRPDQDPRHHHRCLPPPRTPTSLVGSRTSRLGYGWPEPDEHVGRRPHASPGATRAALNGRFDRTGPHDRLRGRDACGDRGPPVGRGAG